MPDFRILIVEDSPTQAEGLRYFLEENALDAEVARSAEAALDILAQKRFDLVLSDVMMPGLNGVEVAASIKSDVATRNIVGVRKGTTYPDRYIVVARALAKSPEERFQSAVEFHEAFARCLAGLPMTTHYASSAPPASSATSAS